MKSPDVKLYLKKEKPYHTHGTIYLRVLVPGKRKYKKRSLGIEVESQYWDPLSQTVTVGRKNHININNNITTKKNQLLAELLDEEKNGRSMTAAKIEDVLNKRTKDKAVLPYIEKHLQRLAGKGYSPRYISDWRSKTITKLTEYGFKDLHFSDVSKDWLDSFEAELRVIVNGKQKHENNTIYAIFRKIKEICKYASDDDLFDMRTLKGHSWPPYKDPVPVYLTIEEVDKIMAAVEGSKLPDGDLIIASFFLIECLSGIRFSDWNNFEIETLIKKKRLKIGETQKTKQPIYLHMDKSPRLTKIVYIIKERGYKFDYAEPYTNRRLKKIAEALKIKKHLTTHVGRHSFATLMLELGYSKETVAEMLGISLRVVETYAKMTRRKIDAEYEKYGGL